MLILKSVSCCSGAVCAASMLQLRPQTGDVLAPEEWAEQSGEEPGEEHRGEQSGEEPGEEHRGEQSGEEPGEEHRGEQTEGEVHVAGVCVAEAVSMVAVVGTAEVQYGEGGAARGEAGTDGRCDMALGKGMHGGMARKKSCESADALVAPLLDAVGCCRGAADGMRDRPLAAGCELPAREAAAERAEGMCEKRIAAAAFAVAAATMASTRCTLACSQRR
jgi:hypothetical protein